MTNGRFGPRHASARVSFEYFPPRDVVAERALVTCAHAMRRFAPAFQTVTFGADGGESESTTHWAVTLDQLTEVPTAAHVTLCAFDTPDAFLAHVDALREAGIARLVVLRGDAVGRGNGLAGFTSVAEAVAAIGSRHRFDISVAAYPETHPKAESAETDLDALMAKFDAGAARALTQFFFDNDDFLRLRDRLARRRPNATLVPGVMPVASFARVARFAERCGARVPDAMRERFEAASGDRSIASDVARDAICEQVRSLAGEGVRDLHVYTMNRVDLAADAARAFQAARPQDSESVSAVA